MSAACRRTDGHCAQRAFRSSADRHGHGGEEPNLAQARNHQRWRTKLMGECDRVGDGRTCLWSHGTRVHDPRSRAKPPERWWVRVRHACDTLSRAALGAACQRVEGRRGMGTSCTWTVVSFFYAARGGLGGGGRCVSAIVHQKCLYSGVVRPREPYRCLIFLFFFSSVSLCAQCVSLRPSILRSGPAS